MNHCYSNLPAAFSPTQCIGFPKPLQFPSSCCVPVPTDTPYSGVPARLFGVEVHQLAPGIAAGLETLHDFGEKSFNIGSGCEETHSLRRDKHTRDMEVGERRARVE